MTTKKRPPRKKNIRAVEPIDKPFIASQAQIDSIKRAQESVEFKDRCRDPMPRFAGYRQDRFQAAVDELDSDLVSKRAAERGIPVEQYRKDSAFAQERGELRRQAWEKIKGTRRDLLRYGLARAWFAIYHCELSSAQNAIPVADYKLAERLCEHAATLLELASGLQMVLVDSDGARTMGGDWMKLSSGGRPVGTVRQWAEEMVDLIERAEWPARSERQSYEDRAAMLRDGLQELFRKAGKQRTARRNALKREGRTDHAASLAASREIVALLRKPVWDMTNACALVADGRTLDEIMKIVSTMFDGDLKPRPAAVSAAEAALRRWEKRVASSTIRDATPNDHEWTTRTMAKLRSIVDGFSTGN